jgi:hypothetical protein
MTNNFLEHDGWVNYAGIETACSYSTPGWETVKALASYAIL